MSERLKDEENMETAGDAGEDRIGALPGDLLSYLMSFLPSHDAVRTCVLAKRWRTLWKSVPALRLTDGPSVLLAYEDHAYEYKSHEDMVAELDMQGSSRFVDELLRLRDPTPLNVCVIDSSYYVPDWYYDDYDQDNDSDGPEAFQRIEPWIRYALSHEVRVLRVDADSSVTNLALVSSHLKRVELISMHFECSLDFSSCPVLDALEMSSCTISASILSPSLRHLIIRNGSFDCDVRSRISAPNLIRLKLGQDHGLPPMLDSMPSLITAYVMNVCEYDNYSEESFSVVREESFSVVLQGLSSATNLELIAPCYYQDSVFIMDLKWCPTFSKLKTLLLNDWCLADNFTGMVYFLKHSPIIEMLTLQLNFVTSEKYHLSETYEVCNSWEQGYTSTDKLLLSKNLKIVKIIRGKKEDVTVQRIVQILCTHGVPSEKIDIQ